MTSESKSDTEPFIEKTRAAYAYAYDKSGKVARYFGVSGIPHAFLIDPTGTVVWEGHPARLSEETIQSSLAGALKRPLFDWPPASKSVAQSVVHGDLADALEKAGKLSEADEGPQIVAEVRGIIEGRLKAAESSLSEGDLLGAKTSGEELVKGLKGLPEQERAQKVLDSVESHADAKAILGAQEKIAKVREKDPSKRKELERALEDMKKITSELPGTYAAKQAEAYMAELRDKLRR